MKVFLKVVKFLNKYNSLVKETSEKRKEKLKEKITKRRGNRKRGPKKMEKLFATSAE